MFSICFEPEVLSSGRRLYLQLWYSVFTCNGINSLVGERVCSLLIPLHVNKLYPTCKYSHLPKDKPSGLKHVDDNLCK
jgi:hypothetical protein